MQLYQALILAVLQGISELFPVSSLGQTILLRALLGWDFGTDQKFFLDFLVALHLATAVALLIYFWKDWVVVIKAFLGSISRKKLVYDRDSKFAWLLVAGTPIVGLAGLVFDRRATALFTDLKLAWIVAAVLIANGFIMLFADFVKRRAEAAKPAGVPQELVPAGAGGPDPAAAVPSERKKAEDLTFIEGAAIGATQTLALLPGISRSGVSIVAGLFAGLSYEEATRFSFMLATPLIGLAALKKLPELRHDDAHQMLMLTIPSAIVAGITAYLSTRFLMRYFRHNRLSPFGWYCIVFGIFALIKLHP